MNKYRLSEKLRKQLDSLGKSLAGHTRSLNEHFDNQETFLLEREINFAAQQQKFLEGNSEDDELTTILSPFLKGDFEKMTVAELRRVCKKNGVKRFSRLKKAQLLEILGDQKIQPPPLPVNKVIKHLKRPQLEKIVSYFILTIL